MQGDTGLQWHDEAPAETGRWRSCPLPLWATLHNPARGSKMQASENTAEGRKPGLDTALIWLKGSRGQLSSPRPLGLWGVYLRDSGPLREGARWRLGRVAGRVLDFKRIAQGNFKLPLPGTSNHDYRKCKLLMPSLEPRVASVPGSPHPPFGQSSRNSPLICALSRPPLYLFLLHSRRLGDIFVRLQKAP